MSNSLNIITDNELDQAYVSDNYDEEVRGALSLVAEINNMIIQGTLNLKRKLQPGEKFGPMILGSVPSLNVQEVLKGRCKDAGWLLNFSGPQVALEGGCTMSLMKILE